MGMGLVSPSLLTFHTPKRVTSLLEKLQNFSPAASKVSYIGDFFWVTCPPYVILCQWLFASEIPSTRVDESVSVALSWTSEIKSDLTWRSDARNLLAGVSLVSPQPDLLFWSDM